MKKLITFILVICLGLLCVACGTSKQSKTTTTEKQKEKATTEKSTSKGKDDSKKTLVVYFSMTGNTKAIATSIKKGLNADIFEIVPKKAYTDADLDYNDDNSRSTKEMNDTTSRPEIKDEIQNIDQYSTIYIGYPIWWGEAPRILDTFVESYDFTDKKIVPFCTSSSSGIGSSAQNLEKLAGKGTWNQGKRFSGNESYGEVMKWVNGVK